MKPIEGWDEYKAGEDGVIYRVLTRGRNPQEPTPVKPWAGSSGYPQIYMTRKGLKITRMVHRIIAEAWHGKSDLEVNHKNGNKSDSRPCNLEWVTRAQNISHARSLGRFSSSSKCEISIQERQLLLEMRKSGTTLSALSSRFKIPLHFVVKICNHIDRKI